MQSREIIYSRNITLHQFHLSCWRVTECDRNESKWDKQHNLYTNRLFLCVYVLHVRWHALGLSLFQPYPQFYSNSIFHNFFRVLFQYVWYCCGYLCYYYCYCWLAGVIAAVAVVVITAALFTFDQLNTKNGAL